MAQPPDPLYALRGNMSSVLCMLFRDKEHSEYLYVGTTEGRVHVWQLSNFREVMKIQVSTYGCLAVFYEDDKFITQEKGGNAKIWRETESTWEFIIDMPMNYIGFCKMVAYNNLLICPGDNSKVQLKRLDNGTFDKELCIMNSQKLGQVMCMIAIKSLQAILVAFETGDLILWDVNKCCKITAKNITSDCPMALDFCEATNEGVVGTSGEQLIKFAIEDQSIQTVCDIILTNPGVSSVALHPEGKLCVAGCWDGRIRYFSMKKLNLLAVLDHHTGSVENVVFSKKKLKCCDSILLAAGGTDGRVTLWTLFSG